MKSQLRARLHPTFCCLLCTVLGPVEGSLAVLVLSEFEMANSLCSLDQRGCLQNCVKFLHIKKLQAQLGLNLEEVADDTAVVAALLPHPHPQGIN